jgi:hypothetical protein
MAENNPELQVKLQELDAELEVLCPSIPCALWFNADLK